MHLHPRTTGIAIAEAREALAQNGERSDRIVPLADGFNSHAYLIDSEIVVKVGRRAFSPERAKATLSEAFDFYNLLKNFHGDSALDTSFSLATDLTDSRKLRLVSTQRFIEGLVLPESVDYDREQLVVLYEEALNMFERTRKIGDFACIEGGFFDPLKSRNVIVRPNGEPVLTDVDTGRIQGSALLGSQWNRFIANGVRRGLEGLSKTG